MRNILKLKNIKFWWLRFLFLLTLGVPAFSGWPLNIAEKMALNQLSITENMAHIAIWISYSCFVWIVVLINAGGKKLLEYLAVSFVMGLTTAMLGAVMRKLLPILAGGLTVEQISFKMINLLIVMITVVPYCILFINSFSAKNLMDNVTKLGGKRKAMGLHFALAYRIIQHTGEIVFNLYEIWIEEHPDKLLPRHRRDWGLKWYSSANVFPWIGEALNAWIFACIMYAFEPIPAMVEEVEKINNLDGKGD
jgi:hypothetical protein